MKPLRKLLPAALCVSAFAQQAPVKPQKDVPGDAVVAVLNGRKYTADEIREIVQATPPQARAMYARNPKQFLREHASLLAFVAMAEKDGLANQSPYKEQLAFYRMYVLSNAAINNKKSTIEVDPAEQKAYYEAHKADYREAKVRMIYFPFSDDKSEAAAKVKAEGVAKKARGGEDFVKLAKENSEDATGAGGEFSVTPESSQPPEHMKKVLLASKAGAITDPLRHENGYYVFRVESSDVLPYEKVRDEVFKTIQNTKFAAWQQQVQSQVSVQIENEAFFQNAGQQQ